MLSGCSGKSDQTEKTLRVGVITYTQDDPFINGLTDELKAQLKAMENKERRIIVSTKSGNDDQQEQNDKIASERRMQVGTGDRSERIRTYNFPQGRMTDHRIGLTLYRLEDIMNGNLDEVFDALATADELARLAGQREEA